jgi:predicted dienelactone hydrolase
MSAAVYLRKLRHKWPHDYIRRHRMFRRITNVLLVCVLSVAAAYIITSGPGKPVFSIPHADQHAAATASRASDPAPARAANTPGAAAYESQAGPYSVAEVPDVVLHDSKRDRDVHLRIFYPDQSGKFPVILFSHGAGGSQTCCDDLTRHWASYGYVTLQPTHDDSAKQRRDAGTQNVRLLQAVRDALKNPALWESRPLDISLVIDSLPGLQQRLLALAGKLDMDHIGVGGHSMGSFTSEAIAGALVDLPGRPSTNMADTRVKAILCLSPQGPGQFGLTDHSFDQLALPYLGVTGTLDNLGPVASPAWHKIPFERSQPGDKYEVLIQGANHMSFITAQTLLPSRAPQAESILEYTNSAALAFWDAYLKHDSAAKRYLQSDALEKFSQGAVELDRR